MGMTIDEAITWLNTDDYESKGFADATGKAIDTMRKYQKIKEIYKNWSCGADSCDCMKDIEGVIENGKID